MCQALRFLSEKRQMWLMFSGCLFFQPANPSGGGTQIQKIKGKDSLVGELHGQSGALEGNRRVP